jgi:hypothetical protein
MTWSSTGERGSGGAGETHGVVLPDRGGRKIQQYQMIGAGPRKQESAPLGRALDQRLVGLAHPGNVPPPGIDPHHLHQLCQPGAGHFGGHMIAQPNGRRPLPNGVHEGVRIIEVGFSNEAQGLLKVGVGLPGKSNDDVGGERNPGDGDTKSAHHFQVAFPGVPPEHPPEYGVGSTLHRQMHVFADRAGCGHGLDDSGGELGGIGAGESEPTESLDSTGGP